MNARITQAFVTAFAGLLGAMGIALTFFPAEIGAALFGSSAPDIVLAVLGGALFGLGYLNWLTRAAPIGGIYGRPVVITNLAHFVVGGLALIRHCLAQPVSPWLWIVTFIYLGGLAFYGSLMFISPARA